MMIGQVPRKRCSGPCGRELPATVDYFYRCRSSRDGLRYDCKTCAVAATAAYRERRKANGGQPFGRGIGKPHKCTGPCGRVLPWTTEHYYVNKREPDGSIKALYPKCKACTRQRVKEHRLRNYRKVRAREKELREARMRDPEFVERQRRYWEAHRERERNDPRALRRARETRRMTQRLRAEREGRPSAESDAALRDEAGGYLPAAPLADAIRRWMAGIVDATREDAAAACGVDARTIFGWLGPDDKPGPGAYEQVRLDAADRALIGLDLLWFDVWDPVEFPRAVELFEGVSLAAA